ncbi:hypothetical protein FOXYSP1_03199 [Fusarium oxysporum f. sp. phaseoli]
MRRLVQLSRSSSQPCSSSFLHQSRCLTTQFHNDCLRYTRA